MEENILDDFSGEALQSVRRRAILPVWIKIFIWIFMILGVADTLFLFAGLAGMKFELEMYGLETDDPGSMIGVLLITLFFFKGLVAFFLWFEQRSAILLGIIDAIVGLFVCVDVMLNFPIAFVTPHTGSFRLEIIFLVIYLVKLVRIRARWELR